MCELSNDPEFHVLLHGDGPGKTKLTALVHRSLGEVKKPLTLRAMGEHTVVDRA